MGGGRLCETVSARFCKELWARLRVHSSGSVHGLSYVRIGSFYSRYDASEVVRAVLARVKGRS
jgi:hypothetical protein